MLCPKCNSKTKVTNCRIRNEGYNYKIRRRRCTNCGYLFTTIESEAFVEIKTTSRYVMSKGGEINGNNRQGNSPKTVCSDHG